MEIILSMNTLSNIDIVKQEIRSQNSGRYVIVK
jgi:hypothetical protein